MLFWHVKAFSLLIMLKTLYIPRTTLTWTMRMVCLSCSTCKRFTQVNVNSMIDILTDCFKVLFVWKIRHSAWHWCYPFYLFNGWGFVCRWVGELFRAFEMHKRIRRMEGARLLDWRKGTWVKALGINAWANFVQNRLSNILPVCVFVLFHVININVERNRVHFILPWLSLCLLGFLQWKEWCIIGGH